jgi:23S rRNA pseudouridine2605 synthase
VDERIHKLMAQHGIGSRRQVEDWIRAGRVLVNGRAATVGQRVSSGDRIIVDGSDVTRRISTSARTRSIVYHKPSGEMLRSRAGDERAHVETQLPALPTGRWVAVNPIGYGEDGLLVLTSDGSLASAAARNGRLLPVEYRVRVLRPERSEDPVHVPSHVDVDGQPVTFDTVEAIEAGATNQWFEVTASRAVPRGAVRALFDAAGLKVSRVLLVRWGPFSLPRDLPRGRSRELSDAEMAELLRLAGRPAVTEPRTAARSRRARRAEQSR